MANVAAELKLMNHLGPKSQLKHLMYCSTEEKDTYIMDASMKMCSFFLFNDSNQLIQFVINTLY